MRGIAMTMAGLLLGLLLGRNVLAEPPGEQQPTPQAPAEAATAPAATPAGSQDAPAAATVQAPGSKEQAGPPAKLEVKAAAVPDDPVICKKKTDPGTLGRTTKTCMTKSQWDKQREQNRKAMDAAFGSGYGGTGRSAGGG